jgi:hypothetical protein
MTRDPKITLDTVRTATLMLRAMAPKGIGASGLVQSERLLAAIRDAAALEALSRRPVRWASSRLRNEAGQWITTDRRRRTISILRAWIVCGRPGVRA